MSPTEHIKKMVGEPGVDYTIFETIPGEKVYVHVDDPGLKLLAGVPEEDLVKYEVKYEKQLGVGNGPVNIGAIVVPESE